MPLWNANSVIMKFSKAKTKTSINHWLKVVKDLNVAIEMTAETVDLHAESVAIAQNATIADHVHPLNRIVRNVALPQLTVKTTMS